MLKNVVLALLFCGLIRGQGLKDCKTVFIQSTPESLDGFIASQLVKWSGVKVVGVEEKADCTVGFGRQTSTLAVRSSQAASDQTLVTDSANRELPKSMNLYGAGASAAMNITHRQSSIVVWAESKNDFWSLSGGPKTLAEKLVGQLKKDYSKSK